MSAKKKISVCVPTYNRPETLTQLIHTFQKQAYSNKELVISDDTPNQAIHDLVESVGDSDIKYFHNPKGLGFAMNLRKAIERASGDYLILLGDDDLFVDSNVLTDYVSVFEKHPSVGFVYANQLQFTGTDSVQFQINFTNEDRLYTKGEDAMEHVWIRSIFIGGIGVRNEKNLTRYYPKEKILHPQVAFIGHIINHSDAYLIAKNYIGFRSHDDQIIFRAMKQKKIRQAGNHMTVELFEMFTKLQKQYHLQPSTVFLENQLIGLQCIMLFKEKSVLGNEQMEENYNKFCSLSPVARNSWSFRLSFYAAKILPAFIITSMRLMALKLVAFRHREQNAVDQKRLSQMIAV